MSQKDLVIINNEKISKEDKKLFCDNIDIKSIPENLNKYFNVTLIARDSKIKRKHQINLERINNSPNIFSFLFKIFKTFKKKKQDLFDCIDKLHILFFSYILLFLFKKKIFVYLRSNGYEEYKEILDLLDRLFITLCFKSSLSNQILFLVKKSCL